ncbi:MAG: DUF2909 domain-containing protein [Gammaproteobacteria bacterium]
MTDTPFIKAFIIAVFVLILVALGSAARSLFRRGGENSTATVKALTVRVALSFALIITLGVLYALGVIEPNR